MALRAVDRCPLLIGFCCKTLRVSIAELRFELWQFVGRAPFVGAAGRYQHLTRRLRKTGLCQRWRGTAEKPGEPPQVLRGCCEQDFVPDATQAAQPEPVEPENPFHVRKSHLNLLAFTARLLEGFRIGQCTDAIAYIFVEVAGDFARDRRRALRFQ